MQTLEEVESHSWLGISWLKADYMYVWMALLILTLCEVIVPEPSIIGLGQFPGFLFFEPRTLQVILLISLALTKTFWSPGTTCT